MSWTPEQMAESYGPEMFKDTAMSEFIKEWGGILGAEGRKELAEHEKRIRHDERLKTIGECRADCYDIELRLSESTFRGKYQKMDETLREYVARLERDSERLEWLLEDHPITRQILQGQRSYVITWQPCQYLTREEIDEAIRHSQTANAPKIVPDGAIEPTTDEKTESLEIVGENEGEN